MVSLAINIAAFLFLAYIFFVLLAAIGSMVAPVGQGRRYAPTDDQSKPTPIKTPGVEDLTGNERWIILALFTIIPVIAWIASELTT